MVRSCLQCHHFYFAPAAPDLSECAPGNDISIGCMENHWWMGRGDTEESFCRRMESAGTCKDFQERVLDKEEKAE